MKKLFVVVIILGLIIGAASYLVMNMPEDHQHVLGDWYFTVEPTCTSDGIQERKCECGYGMKKNVTASGHKYEKSETVGASCTEMGYDVLACVGCGDTIKDNITDAKGHTFGAWLTADDPTCTAEGKKERFCNCGFSESEKIPQTDHIYELSETVEPSCTEKGYDKLACASCGDVQKTNFTEMIGHVFGEWITVSEPTCTSCGERERLCSCGMSENEVLPLIDHTYTFVKTYSPSCTEKGYDIYACSVCGDEEQNNVKEMLDHTWLDGKCIQCDKELKCPDPIISADNVIIPFGGNTYVTWTLSDAPLFEVEYDLYIKYAGGTYQNEAGDAIFKSWKNVTSFEINESHLKEPGEYVITLRARYVGVACTEGSASIKITLKEKTPLDAPEITTATGQKIKLGENFTLAWRSVFAERANVIYSLYVMKDGRPETRQLIGVMSDTIFIISKLCFDKVDSYVISIVATDINGIYTDSNEAEARISLSVEPMPTEDIGAYRNAARYANNYYYEYIGTLPNGKGMQTFYNAINEVIAPFHDDSTADASFVKYTADYSFHKLETVNYKQYGITTDEAISVFWLYVMDHPLYYWLSNNLLYNSSSVDILVHESYADGEVRCGYNSIIYNGVEKIMQNVIGVQSSYLIALSHYESVVKGADYAYEPSDGETPEDDDWAHSILGFFDGGRGVVCEGFAETFSLLLNFSNIENMLIDGYSNGEPHSWNLVRMDDGSYYWCDPTWDDTELSLIGYDYKYFCVNDTQNVWYYQNKDGGNSGWRKESFVDNHSVKWFEIKIDMSGAIPPRASDTYKGVGDELIMRRTFSVDGMTYAVTGYRKVQLVKIEKNGDIVIPETVYYNGMSYKVVSIGSIDENGVYGCNSVLNEGVRSIFIPKTVRHIWIKNSFQHALFSYDLESVTIDEENEFYEIYNGVLQKKKNTKN